MNLAPDDGVVSIAVCAAAESGALACRQIAGAGVTPANRRLCGVVDAAMMLRD
jgi:hypothetical protein